MDGQNCEPDGMEFFQRLTRKIIMQILNDKSFDIFSLEPILLAQLEDFCGKNQISDEAFKIKIPRILFKTCEEDGLHWIAGRCNVIAIRVVIFSKWGYKIRKIFG